MFNLEELGAWASILGLVVGLAAAGISIWVLLRVEKLSRRLVLDVRVPSLIEPIRKAASMLKDAQFQESLLEQDARADIRRILARLERSRNQLPAEFGERLSELKQIELAVFEDSVASTQELYTHMVIVSDILEDLVEERRLGARNG